MHSTQQHQIAHQNNLHQEPCRSYLLVGPPIGGRLYTVPGNFRILYVTNVEFRYKEADPNDFIQICWVSNVPLHANQKYPREGRSQPNHFATYPGARAALNKWSAQGMLVGKRDLAARERGLWDGQEWTFFPPNSK